MFIDDLLVPAEMLLNGINVCQLGDVESVEYFHLELAAHDVIFANGAASETFVDCDSRGMFHNAIDYALAILMTQVRPGSSVRHGLSPHRRLSSRSAAA